MQNVPMEKKGKRKGEQAGKKRGRNGPKTRGRQVQKTARREGKEGILFGKRRKTKKCIQR